MKELLAIFLILIAGIAWAQNDSGDIQEVLVDGYGSIFQGEKLIGRDAAIKDALRNAVEQVVGTMIDSQTKVKNFQVISDEIYSKSQGYVEKYEIIAEGAEDSNTYKVQIKALVSKTGIKDKLMALKVLLVQQNMPRVVVFLKQNMFGGGWQAYFDSTSIAEELIQGELINKGFVVLDKNQRAANLDRSVAQAAIDGDTKAAQKLATMYGADIFITGTVVGNVSENSLYGGFLSAAVDMAIKAIKTDTGEIVAAVSDSKKLAPVSNKVTGTNTVMKQLAPAIVGALTDKLMAKWQSGNKYVHITLKGIGYSQYVKFANFLKTRVRMVDNVYKRGFTSGVAELDLETAKSGEEVAEELILREADIPFKIEIMDVTRSSITLKRIQ